MASDVMRRLSLSDIADSRAYERERAEFSARVMDLKRRRRVHVGPIITLLFENRDTVRYQIQEMARVEHLSTDEQIITELDIYNPLIPEPGQVCATMFIELTSKDELMEWLPKLVGVERAVELRIRGGDSPMVVPCEVEEAHAEQLTREEITASVHYVRFKLTPEQVEAFAAGPVAVAVAHDAYEESTVLSDETRDELLKDLRED